MTLATAALVGFALLSASGSTPVDTVKVEPGHDLPALVEIHPEGTVFLLAPGRYGPLSIVPKTGNHFVAQGLATFDGGDSTAYAFHWSEARVPDDVTIRGLTIQRYAPPPQMGAVLAGWHQGGPQTRGWTVEGSTVRLNATAGIRIGHEMTLRGNRIVLNGQIGITGIGDGVIVEDNDIALNNREGNYDILWEAGGAKFVLSSDLTVRGNRVTRNHGPGLWTDIECDRVLYQANIVTGNTGVGILHEISYTAEVVGNTLVGNGDGFHVWGHGAAVLIQNSRDVDVHGNVVKDNARGIVAMHQDRGEGSRGRYEVDGIRVHDNDIQMTRGFSGFVQDVGDRSLFDGDRDVFRGNRYGLGRHTGYFAWWDRLLSEARWQGAGLDEGSTFERPVGEG